MKNNPAIYDVVRFKKEGDAEKISEIRRRANRKRNLPDDEDDGAIWIRKYRDISFTDGLRNFATFLWRGDPNKRKLSDLDNLTKDASNVKNVESVITNSSEETLNRPGASGVGKRF